MTSTETELAYIAGFFDGEGCITTTLRKTGYSFLRVQISQNNIAPLQFILDRFEGGYIRPQRKCFELVYSGTKALPVLKAMLPFLIVKREQAELAIEWISVGGTTSAHLKPEGKARRLEIDGELRLLKAV